MMQSVCAATVRPQPLLFDDWSKEENEPSALREMASWKSPDKLFTIILLKVDEDAGRFKLIGRQLNNGREVALGYGNNAVNVRWIETKAGAVAVIDHGISSGLNELFVIRPVAAQDWILMYKTPPHWGPDGLAVDHCYWSIVSVDVALGTLSLKAAWTFSNASRSKSKELTTEAEYTVPIYYGFRLKSEVGR